MKLRKTRKSLSGRLSHLLAAFVVLLLLIVACQPAAPAPTTAPPPAATKGSGAPAPTAAGGPASTQVPAAQPTVAKAPVALPESYKFGVSSPLTGPAGNYGEMHKQGIEIAVEEINAAGGVNGRKMAVVYDDHQMNAGLAATGFQKLINVDKVPYVISSGSSIIASQLPIAKEHNIVMWAITTSSPVLAGKHPYLFMSITYAPDEIVSMVEYAVKELGLKKIAVFYRGDDYGFMIRDVAKEELKKYNMAPVAEETHELGATSFSAQIAKLKAADPDAIYIGTYSKEAVTFMKQARDLGVKSQFLGLTGLGTPEVAATPAAEGLIYTSQLFSESASDRSKAYFAKYKEKAGMDPTPDSGNAYEGVYFLKAIIDKATQMGKGYDGKSLGEAARALGSFDSLGGKMEFREDGTVKRPAVLRKLSGGKSTDFKVLTVK